MAKSKPQQSPTKASPAPKTTSSSTAPASAKRKRISGKELMDLVGRKLLFSLMGFGLGLLAFWQSQTLFVNDDSVQAMGKACEASFNVTGFQGPRDDDAEFLNTYHDYEPKLGGTFVCFLTQFLHRLVLNSPAGFITWAATFSTFLPAIVLIVLEAGRVGATGPLKFPTVTLLLAQFFGISVVFPGLWIPSYIWGRASAPDRFKGAVNQRRAVISRFLVLPGFIGTALVFGLDPASRAWTITAGCVGGPLLGLVPLVCWRMHPPASNDQATPQMVHSAVTSYSIAGMLGFLLWAAVLATVVLYYRFDYPELFKDCWLDAHAFVKFMVIDATVLYVGMLVYVGYVRLSAVAETLLQTVFFGPGAALAATMATFEMERSPLVTPRQQQQDKRAKKD